MSWELSFCAVHLVHGFGVDESCGKFVFLVSMCDQSLIGLASECEQADIVVELRNLS